MKKKKVFISQFLGIGDNVLASVKKGKPELRKKGMSYI